MQEPSEVRSEVVSSSEVRSEVVSSSEVRSEVVSSEMESSEKTSSAQELPPNQAEGSHPVQPALTPDMPPGNVTHAPYPMTMMPGGQPPVMYPPAYPTAHVVMAQPAGGYSPYNSSVPVNVTQHQPLYTVPINPQPQHLPTNQQPYPVTTAPGPYPPFNSQPGYGTQPVIVSQQQYTAAYPNVNASMAPPPHYNALGFTRPKDYLCWSILNLLFCFCPLGIAAVVFSSKTSDAVAKQDWIAAKSHSSTAFILNCVSLLLGFTFYLIVLFINLP